MLETMWRRKASYWVIVVLAGLSVAPCFAEDIWRPEATTAISPRLSVTAENFMVATAHPLATQAGYDVLAAGGSAADAAVAVQAMLGLVEPQSSGLGGGGFLLYWDAKQAKLFAYDARETAPLAADGSYWLDETGRPLPFQEAVIGGRSAGVPGVPRLLELVHDDHGALPLANLLDPAIERAEQGFLVSPRLAASIAAASGLALFPETAGYFFDANGRPLEAGRLLKNPDYAQTLRRFAEHGADVFYTGEIAQAIIAALDTDVNPGLLSAADFAAYQVRRRDPLCVDYRDFEVCGIGSPSSGTLTIGQILGMLGRFDLAAMGDGVQARHLFVEASRLAFADRDRYMADSDFVPMPEGLLDPAYLDERSGLIDPDRAMGLAQPGAPFWDSPVPLASDEPRPRQGTSHFSIVDAQGNMVSATTTIEAGFGNRVMVAGFLLNNELTDFSFKPQVDGVDIANRVQPGKRPRSSMAPTIVFKNNLPVLLTGSPGGAEIIAYTALSIIAILDWDLDPQAAIDLPHVTNLNGTTNVEAGANTSTLATALSALGHEVVIRDLNSGLHAISARDNHYVGAADKRREGLVMGQ